MAISAAVLAKECSVAFTVGILMPNKELGQLTAVLGHLPCRPVHFRVPRRFREVAVRASKRLLLRQSNLLQQLLISGIGAHAIQPWIDFHQDHALGAALVGVTQPVKTEIGVTKQDIRRA